MGFFNDLMGGGARNDVNAGVEKSREYLKDGYKKASQAVSGGYKKGDKAITSGDNAAIDYLEPSMGSGAKFSDMLGVFMGADGADAQKTAYDNFQTTPGFQKKLEAGQQQAERSASARGYATSPRLLMELRDYGHRMLGDEFDNYLTRLDAGASRGQQAATQAANIRSTGGRTRAELFGRKGETLAGLATGKAGAFTNLRMQQAEQYANSRMTMGDLAPIIGDAAKAFAGMPPTGK
jgi:hypothetical protein